jgi:hypothetical protein
MEGSAVQRDMRRRKTTVQSLKPGRSTTINHKHVISARAFSPQIPRLTHQLLVLVLLHLQPPLPLDVDGLYYTLLSSPTRRDTAHPSSLSDSAPPGTYFRHSLASFGTQNLHGFRPASEESAIL